MTKERSAEINQTITALLQEVLNDPEILAQYTDASKSGLRCAYFQLNHYSNGHQSPQAKIYVFDKAIQDTKFFEGDNFFSAIGKLNDTEVIARRHAQIAELRQQLNRLESAAAS